MKLIEIGESNHEILKPFRDLKYNISDKYIVVDGSQTLENLILKGAIPQYIVATHEYYDTNRMLPNCPLYVCDRSTLKEVVGFNVHQGVMALFKNIPFVTPSELSDRILCLNGLSSAENVGTIARSCTSFEIDSFLFDSKTISPYSRRAVRVSMGHFYDLKVSRTENLVATLDELKKNGHTIIGSRNSPNSISLNDYQFPQRFVLIIGAEGQGMDSEIEEIADINLRIDLKAGIDSLNAAQACSIMLYAQSLMKQ